MLVPAAAASVQARWFVPDLFKAVGCVLIVLHHLAFYGPMADAVSTAWPAVIAWLQDHARLVVQVFLVVAGFLCAQGLQAVFAWDVRQLLQRLGQRYLRLSLPLLAALSFTVVVSEGLRPFFVHDSLSATPTGWQVLAHVAMLQHALDQEALSAGVWYVAIDLQLYALSLVLAWLLARLGLGLRALQVLWLVLTLGALLWWNRMSVLEDWAPYFAGAYGMGVLAGLARMQTGGGAASTASLGLVVLGALAWWVEPRERLMLACLAATSLVLVPKVWMQGPQGLLREAIDILARVSYSVFVLHFGVSLVVNAVFSQWLPPTATAQGVGMVLALVLSLLGGLVLYRLTEQDRPSLQRWLVWAGVFMASSGLAMHWAQASA